MLRSSLLPLPLPLPLVALVALVALAAGCPEPQPEPAPDGGGTLVARDAGLFPAADGGPAPPMDAGPAALCPTDDASEDNDTRATATPTTIEISPLAYSKALIRCLRLVERVRSEELSSGRPASFASFRKPRTSWRKPAKRVRARAHR